MRRQGSRREFQSSRESLSPKTTYPHLFLLGFRQLHFDFGGKLVVFMHVKKENTKMPKYLEKLSSKSAPLIFRRGERNTFFRFF